MIVTICLLTLIKLICRLLTCVTAHRPSNGKPARDAGDEGSTLVTLHSVSSFIPEKVFTALSGYGSP